MHLKAAPVVNMVAMVSFDRKTKQIDLEDEQCRLRDGSRVPCLQVHTALHRLYTYQCLYLIATSKQL